MKSVRHLFCTLLLCLPAALQAAESRNAIFGVELGTRFQFPACARNQDALTGSHCHNAAQKVKTSRGTEEHRVFYPRPKVVPWARGELQVETTMDGIIVAIHVNTWGLQGQDTALADLIAKYGPPTRQRSEKITGQRSRFPSKFAEWDLKDIWVSLDGTTSTVDWGRVTLATPEHRRRMQAGGGK